MAERVGSILLGVTVDMSVRLVDGFSRYLVDKGWDVHVVSSPGSNLSELARLEGVTAHALKMSRDPDILRDLKALVAWIRLLRSVRPDVVSVGTPKAGLLGTTAAWITRVPHRVYVLRGLRLETVRGPARKILEILERVAMSRAHRVIAVSASLRREVLALGLCRAERILVLGEGSSNGVDVRRFARRRHEVREVEEIAQSLDMVPGIPTIGFVGRLTEDKGLSTLAEARAILDERGIDHQLLLVGGLDTQDSGAALGLLHESGRAPIEAGSVAEVAPYYQLIDVLCLPTRREGFPNVVLEAAAAGIPTVTTDATGAVDSVVEGKTGRIARRDDPIALADALEELIVDPDRRSRLGAAAQRRAEAWFSNEYVWGLHEGFYRRLTEGRLERHGTRVE